MPRRPSPDVAEALCLNVLVLLPSWMLSQPPLLQEVVTSEATVVVPSVSFRPTYELAELLPRTSPLVTLESFEVLRASTEARPPETTPET